MGSASTGQFSNWGSAMPQPEKFCLWPFKGQGVGKGSSMILEIVLQPGTGESVFHLTEQAPSFWRCGVPQKPLQGSPSLKFLKAYWNSLSGLRLKTGSKLQYLFLLFQRLGEPCRGTPRGLGNGGGWGAQVSGKHHLLSLASAQSWISWCCRLCFAPTRTISALKLLRSLNQIQTGIKGITYCILSRIVFCQSTDGELFVFGTSKFGKCLTCPSWRVILPNKRETILFIYSKIQSNYVWCCVV